MAIARDLQPNEINRLCFLHWLKLEVLVCREAFGLWVLPEIFKLMHNHQSTNI
jgi:hypothetical protein